MNNNVQPWVRVLILILSAGTILMLSRYYTGSYLPSDPREAIIFQNALLLIVLGSALLEHHFTKPVDSVINSLMGLITLVSVYSLAPKAPWLLVAGYCSLVLVLGLTCITVSTGKDATGWRLVVSKLTYRPAVVLGKARLLFTIVFLAGLWFFYSIQDQITLALVIFWGLFLSLWPLRIPELISSWFSESIPAGSATGEIVRIDNPNIVRASLNGKEVWDHSQPMACCLPNGERYWLQPLYSQFQEGRLLGTGLLTTLKYAGKSGKENTVFHPEAKLDRPSHSAINSELGGGSEASLVGFIVERSTIGAIRFETLNPECCYDGMLVWSQVHGERVYYQIVAGETSEEAFSSDRHGYQIATATQLGTLGEESGFTKNDWLPAMNTPVFALAPGDTLTYRSLGESDFRLGVIPNSSIDVGGNFLRDYNHHTALLGVTGSGKTELAFDLIRHSVNGGMKVICIDLTAQYEGRLSDLSPANLSIEEATATELSDRLFDVETGTYGAPNEKRALNEFATRLREQISDTITEFLTNDEGPGLGLIRLDELSNTKATLWITELYMTCLLRYARENIGRCPRILIVVEEAHTVMPEPNAMGLGDFDSKGLVGKIGQIALQGRKYGVGLLVLAQRTATVSKTILTQCNTIISFTCYDDTSLGFLKNIYGPDHIALIPNLPKRHAIAFGKWIKSERPLVFEVPYDKSKDTEEV